MSTQFAAYTLNEAQFDGAAYTLNEAQFDGQTFLLIRVYNSCIAITLYSTMHIMVLF